MSSHLWSVGRNINYGLSFLQILVQHIKTVLPGLKTRISTALVSVAKEHASYGEITESKVTFYSLSKIGCKLGLGLLLNWLGDCIHLCVWFFLVRFGKWKWSKIVCCLIQGRVTDWLIEKVSFYYQSLFIWLTNIRLCRKLIFLIWKLNSKLIAWTFIMNLHLKRWRESIPLDCN